MASEDDFVDIIEAWYNCPTHGMQHHPNGVNLIDPCHECPPSHVWPKRDVDRETLLAEYAAQPERPDHEEG